jgi:superfamily II DNA or RNA helicase
MNRYTNKPDWNKALAMLINDPVRTTLHAEVLRQVATENDFSIMHIANRTKYLQDLYDHLGSEQAGLVVGTATTLPKKRKREAAQKKDVVLTAYKIGKDGIDERRIRALGLGLPIKQLGALIQAVGRTDRDATGTKKKKPSLILDFVDDHWLFGGTKRVHLEHWEQEGYKVRHIDLN